VITRGATTVSRRAHPTEGPGSRCVHRGCQARLFGDTTQGGTTDKLDDIDYPAYTIGTAAGLLGVQPAFLRSLNAAGCSARAAPRADNAATAGAQTGLVGDQYW
jgi:hypothetical protein